MRRRAGGSPCWEATNIRSIHLVVSPDGKRIASHGDHEDHIRLWDAVAGQEVAVLRGDMEYPGALAFSPDGSRLVSGSVYPDNTVRLWDASTGRRVADMYGPQEYDPMGGVRPGRSAHRLGIPRPARRWLWDGVTGQSIAPLGGHTESVWNAIFSPDGRRVVTASADQTLRLWDATSGERIAVLRGHKREVWARRSRRTARCWCHTRPTVSRASGTWSWPSGTGSFAGTRALSTT